MEELPSARELVALLAETDRLRALAAVTLGASTLPEVAERTGLEPRAVHTEALQAAARPPASEAPPSEAREPGGEVLRRFIHNGRLLAMPAAHSKRLVVLDHLAGLFEPGRRYPEPEVNELLKRYHPDYALLRRSLVDDGFLDREDEPAPSGGRSVKVYWRTGGTVELPEPTSS
jgi:hypothetical protein